MTLGHFNVFDQVSSILLLRRLPSVRLVDASLFVINSRSKVSVPVATNRVRAWNARHESFQYFFGQRYLEIFPISPQSTREHSQMEPSNTPQPFRCTYLLTYSMVQNPS